MVLAELLRDEGERVDCLHGRLLPGLADAHQAHCPAHNGIHHEEYRATVIGQVEGDPSHPRQLKERLVRGGPKRVMHRKRDIRHEAPYSTENAILNILIKSKLDCKELMLLPSGSDATSEKGRLGFEMLPCL